MAGLNGDSNVQFVEMSVPNGQHLWGPQGNESVGRTMLVFFNANDQQTGRFIFHNNPNVTQYKHTILIATQAFAFMIELYDPLTDEPTGEYALFEADNFKLDILPDCIPLNTIIPVCAAAQIGATLTSDVEGTSFPAYSEAQHKFCIPSLDLVKM